MNKNFANIKINIINIKLNNKFILPKQPVGSEMTVKKLALHMNNDVINYPPNSRGTHACADGADTCHRCNDLCFRCKIWLDCPMIWSSKCKEIRYLLNRLHFKTFEDQISNSRAHHWPFLHLMTTISSRQNVRVSRKHRLPCYKKFRR